MSASHEECFDTPAATTPWVLKCAHGHRCEAGERVIAELQLELAEARRKEAYLCNAVDLLQRNFPTTTGRDQ